MNLINETNRWNGGAVEPARVPIGQFGPSPQESQNPLAGIVLSLLHILWKWKWLIAPIVVLALIVGAVATLLTTPQYRASATLRIDRNAAKVVSSDTDSTTASTGSAEFYQTEYGVLRSHEVALKAVDALGLDQNIGFLDPKGAARGRMLASPKNSAERNARRDAAAYGISNGLAITPVALSGLVSVAFTGPNPALDAQIANAVGQAYIDYNSQRRVTGSASARAQLEILTATARTQLDDSERKAVEYARAQQIINISPVGKSETAGDTAAQSLIATNLGALNTALTNARTNRILLQQRWEQVQNTPASELPEVQADTALQTLRQGLAAAISGYQQDAAQHGEFWPSIVAEKAQIAQLQREIEDQGNAVKEGIHKSYQIALSQENTLSAEMEKQKGSYLNSQEKNIEYNILLRDVDTNKTEYESDLDRYKDLSQAANVDASNISFVDEAQAPGAPFTPRPARNLAVSGLIGLVLGALLALGIEQLDETVKAPTDIETKLGVPLLGAIPVAPKDVTPAQALTDPRSAMSEAYYSVRTALQFSTRDGAPRSLLVTSARPSEGKSTSAVALAQGFARLGIRTLLIDSDLRNPSLHKLMGVSNSLGLSTLLTGQIDIERAAQATAFDNLFFIACGPLPPNPAELLGGNHMRQLLAELLERFDQVIIDGPPVMGLADAPLLASVAAGTVLVIEAGSTRRSLARSALARLRVGPVQIVGAILSKFQVRRVGYGYGYGAGYGMGHAYSYEYGAGPEPLAKPERRGLLKRKPSKKS